MNQNKIKRLRTQGFWDESDKKVSDLALANRLPFIINAALMILALINLNVAFLVVLVLINFLGVLLPSHVYDYIYNWFIASNIKKPKMGKRSKQFKFSFTIYTFWTFGLVAMINNGRSDLAYIFGAIIITEMLLTGLIDLSIPATIYNIFVKNK